MGETEADVERVSAVERERSCEAVAGAVPLDGGTANGVPRDGVGTATDRDVGACAESDGADRRGVRWGDVGTATDRDVGARAGLVRADD
ncbi:MAG: hypothetical protein GX621_09370 [Pirellulaceae bacterium]|nr:hypothetical protein [Pirellulaceae bacterium]